MARNRGFWSVGDGGGFPLNELPERTDVAIVGAGIMGASTAYFLSTRTDLEVLLIEKDNVASGSTGDSSAILRHHYGGRTVYSRMAWWSHQFYRDFEEHTGGQIAYGENPMVRFATADNREAVQRGFEVLRDLDIPVTRFEAGELDEQFPMIETDPYEFAVSDDAAAYSDGTDAASGLARAAQEAGATVVTGVAVERIRAEGDVVTGVDTGAGSVGCDRVVVTAGPWTKQLLGHHDVEVPLRTTREEVFILDPPDAFRDAHPDLVPTSDSGEGWYVRPDFGGGVLLATHHTGDEVDANHYSDKPDQETILRLLDELEAFVPGLAGAGIKGEYCGLYTSTPDYDFILDQIGPEGCYVGCGFSGHGFKHGPAVGRVLADLSAHGETNFVDLDYFSLDRFENQPRGHDTSGDRSPL